MEFWTEFSTAQVFQNKKCPRGASHEIEFLTCRNAYVSAQIALRNLADFKITKVSLEGAEEFSSRLFRQEYRTFNDGAAYPDELTELKFGEVLDVDVKCFCTQSLWLDFFVPASVNPGLHEIKAKIEAGGESLECVLKLNVSETALPDPDKALFNHEYFFNPANPIYYGGADCFSDKWWDFIACTAEHFKEIRNNAVLIIPMFILSNSGSRRVSETKWEFNFDLWDKYVNVFIEKGAAKSFTISAFCQNVEGKWVDTLGYNGESVTKDAQTPEAEMFIEQMYTAIYNHICEKGMLSMYRTHIEDEPHTCGTWNWVRGIIKRAAPGLPCGEPIDMIESAYGFEDTCDVMVPRINVYEEDPAYFQKVMKKGTKVWTYSCCFPEEGWWLNKFIDLPFIRSRIMEWNCVATGAEGFLHWGFNYWDDAEYSMYGIGNATRFKGDGHIVYPTPEHFGYKISTRYINTRDGNQDADLLLIKLKKNPEAVKEIMAKVVTSYYDFSDDPVNFNDALRSLMNV